MATQKFSWRRECMCGDEFGCRVSIMLDRIFSRRGFCHARAGITSVARSTLIKKARTSPFYDASFLL